MISYEETIKCLESCKHTECSSCPLRREIACLGILRDNATELIKEQKEEIDRYRDYYETMENEIYSFRKDQAEVKFLKNKIRVEAIKEFTDRLTKKIFPFDYLSELNYSVNAMAVKTSIVNLVKEMAEEKSEH